MYPYIGYILYYVFGGSVSFIYLFHYTLFTVSRLVRFSEREGRKQTISSEENKHEPTKQGQTLYTSVTCHLPCTYASSGTRLKLDKQPRYMLKQL